jgi:hypothetical protein
MTLVVFAVASHWQPVAPNSHGQKGSTSHCNLAHLSRLIQSLICWYWRAVYGPEGHESKAMIVLD